MTNFGFGFGLVAQACIRFVIAVYQDDSSDELSDVLDELLLPASDNEDNWELEGDDDDDDEEEDSDSVDEDEKEDGGEDTSEEEDQMMVNGVNGDSGDEDMDSD